MSDETPKKLTNEERLYGENLFLKAQNISMQAERLRNDLATCLREGQEVQVKVADFRKTILEKYGVDIHTARIEPDGTMTPAPNGAGSGVPASGQAMMPTKG